MKYYIVWDQDKREGFITNDAQMAYEVRKLAFSNAYYDNGDKSFMDTMDMAWPEGMDLCTIQEIDIIS